MQEFCATCPDRGAKECQLPSGAEQFSTKARLIGASIAEGLMYIGWASGPRTRYEESGLLYRAEKRCEAINERIEACVVEHQVALNAAKDTSV